jgi:hypothetical protein
MQIIFNETDAKLIAETLAISRDLSIDFDKPYAPGTMADKIYNEALRVVAALRRRYGPQVHEAN